MPHGGLTPRVHGGPVTDGDTPDGDDTGSRSRETHDNTNSRYSAVSRDRDASRGDNKRDWTRDGAGEKQRDWSASSTNDRSRNDTVTGTTRATTINVFNHRLIALPSLTSVART